MVKNDSDLARLLDMSRSAVSRLKARGMPTHSLDAARAWRDANLSPAYRKDVNPARGARRPGSPEAAARAELQQVENLMRDDERALAAGLFEYVADDVRAAMRAVPASARHRVKVSAAVMDSLTAPVLKVMRESVPELVGGGAPMTDEEAESMGSFWYAIAAHEPVPAQFS